MKAAITNLTLQSRLIRNHDILATTIDEELVMMDGQCGKYFGLNSGARKIWELLTYPMSFDELLIALTATYEVEYDQCKEDVEHFLKMMISNQLILIE